MISEKVRKFWRKFCAENPEVNINAPYEVWFFHNNQDSSIKLAELVLSGKKRATSSLMEDAADSGDGGTVGRFSVVTDFDGKPQCVIQTTEVRHLPFEKVDAAFAFDEGEGDCTLEDWRRGHRRFFTECCRELGLEFDESMMISCKRFKVLFPVI